MHYDVLEARHVRDHVLWVRFRDGTAGEVDLGPELRGEVFEPLHDVDYFKRFSIHPQFKTLVWPNDADLAPEFLHEAARRNPRPAPLRRDSDTPRSVLTTVTNGSGRTVGPMPVVSRFLGIVISMYHCEHGVPHFHAAYALSARLSVAGGLRAPARGGCVSRIGMAWRSGRGEIVRYTGFHEVGLLPNRPARAVTPPLRGGSFPLQEGTDREEQT